MLTFLANLALFWVVGTFGTVALVLTVELLAWSVRPPEWRARRKEIMQRWRTKGDSDPWTLFKWWLPMLLLTIFCMMRGRSVGEQLALWHLAKEANAPNPRRDAWLDQTQGPLKRAWAEPPPVADGDIKLYGSHYRMGVTITHLLVKPPDSHEWGAFRIDPTDARMTTPIPFAVSPDPTVLQLACERDTDWLNRCTPSEVRS
jgi:hypothetical protein